MIKEYIYISISGFRIGIILNPSNNTRLKKEFKKNILRLFKGFVDNQSSTTVDFTVEVNDILNFNNVRITQDLLQKAQLRQNENSYFLVYKRIDSNKIRTFFEVSTFQFQVIIQNIVFELISKGDGFMLHASAVQINGYAYLFCGKSGAGKSTAVKLLQPAYPSLSDDLSFIRRLDNGEYYYFQHPFSETNRIPKRDSKRYKVGMIFVIKKAHYFATKKTVNTNFVSKLLIQQLIFPNKYTVKTVLSFISKFEGFNYLYFKKRKKGLRDLINNNIYS